MSVAAIIYIYALYIFDSVLTLCLYKFLCVIISLKITDIYQNLLESLLVEIICIIFLHIICVFVGIISISLAGFLEFVHNLVFWTEQNIHQVKSGETPAQLSLSEQVTKFHVLFRILDNRQCPETQLCFVSESLRIQDLGCLAVPTGQ
jgi:hypothetical protein